MAWSEIRGHDLVRQQFLAAFERGRFGQAYLFAGPEGVGKRLFARELAKALLCERPPAMLTACDRCPACVQVQAETHPDVFFLRTPDDKSELPVEEMRGFCARLAMKAARGARKVGIVEDADDFNQESANSFLKTLEEPPAGTVLILLCTSTDRQLPTILSRCQIVRFAPLEPADLKPILAGQGIVDQAELERLVRLSGGSVSRAIALNDPSLHAFRQRLLEGLTSPKLDFVALTETWNQFIEAVSKEKPSHRLRLSLTLRFLVDSLRGAARLSLGIDRGGETKEQAVLKAFARLGTDRLLELIERCVEADYQIERMVTPLLIIEWVLEPFHRASLPAKAER